MLYLECRFEQKELRGENKGRRGEVEAEDGIGEGGSMHETQRVPIKPNDVKGAASRSRNVESNCCGSVQGE